MSLTARTRFMPDVCLKYAVKQPNWRWQSSKISISAGYFVYLELLACRQWVCVWVPNMKPDYSLKEARVLIL